MEQKRITQIQTDLMKNVTKEDGYSANKIKTTKQKIESTARILNRELLDFHDRYVHDYYVWSIGKIDKELELLKNQNGQTYDYKDPWGEMIQGIYNHDHKIKQLEFTLSRKALTTLQFMDEAEQNYWKKFTNLIGKLNNFSFVVGYGTKVERINGATPDEFSFLITNNYQDLEIHARFIYACGMVNAPHYRFIVTQRHLTK
jgi:hypothetical protein